MSELRLTRSLTCREHIKRCKSKFPCSLELNCNRSIHPTLATTQNRHSMASPLLTLLTLLQTARNDMSTQSTCHTTHMPSLKPCDTVLRLQTPSDDRWCLGQAAENSIFDFAVLGPMAVANTKKTCPRAHISKSQSIHAELVEIWPSEDLPSKTECGCAVYEVTCKKQ